MSQFHSVGYAPDPLKCLCFALRRVCEATPLIGRIMYIVAISTYVWPDQLNFPSSGPVKDQGYRELKLLILDILINFHPKKAMEFNASAAIFK